MNPRCAIPLRCCSNLGADSKGQIVFSDVTELVGLLSPHPTQTAAWADYDDDGWLDLFIGHESSVEVALAVTRAGNLFTTHTAVAAGFDRFAPGLLQQYLGDYAEKTLGISRHDLLALSRQNPDDPSEPFNLAYLATGAAAR